MDPLDTVFDNLDRWRHFPSYQLERRADIFFSVYLKEVVEEFEHCELEDEIIPELPIKHDGSSHSDKVDYALFAKDRSQVFLVELKTDSASLSDTQDAYLKRAKDRGFRRIVEGIRAIIACTAERQKYHHVAVALARLGDLHMPADLEEYTYPRPRAGLASRLSKIEVAPVDSKVHIIYVLPDVADDKRCIDFARFATCVGKYSDPLSQRFAEHLLKWTTIAGSTKPR
jgi:hypothetical protein